MPADEVGVRRKNRNPAPDLEGMTEARRRKLALKRELGLRHQSLFNEVLLGRVDVLTASLELLDELLAEMVVDVSAGRVKFQDAGEFSKVFASLSVQANRLNLRLRLKQADELERAALEASAKEGQLSPVEAREAALAIVAKIRGDKAVSSLRVVGRSIPVAGVPHPCRNLTCDSRSISGTGCR